MKGTYLFTSESVTEGHPDKMCDLISDAVLDAYLEEDPFARVACEVTAALGIITVMGEITSNAYVDIASVVRDTVKNIGYIDSRFGFDANSCAVMVHVNQQSEDISQGVSQSLEARRKKGGDQTEIGAGDQGMMFGMACKETEVCMPAPIFYAHKLCSRLTDVRKREILDYIGPDGKSMVTFEYNGVEPVRADTIVISTQHLASADSRKLYKDVLDHVILPVIPERYVDANTKFYINPSGRFVTGGPAADTGLTGRKIIVDTYGGAGRHGGGAFSGKDPTKVDRTGAYAARYVAKNIVAAGVAKRCEVQIAYAIGVAEPVSVRVDTFQTSDIPEVEIEDMISELFDLRPGKIIEAFRLRRPIYKPFASLGHFGRTELNPGWEKTDRADEINEYFSRKR